MQKKIILFLCVCCQIFTFGQAEDFKKLDSINALTIENKVSQGNYNLEYIKNKINTPAVKSDQTRYAKSLETLNVIYYYQGEYDLCIETILKAIRIYEKQKNVDKLIDTYGLYGYQIKRRDMKKGEKYMNKALKLIEKNKIKNKAYVIENYGVLKEMQKQYDSALYFYNQAFEQKKLNNDLMGMSYVLNKLGTANQFKKDYKKAETYFIKALNIRKQLNDTLGIAESYGFLGELFQTEKKLEKAKLNFLKSTNLAKQKDYLFLQQKNYLFLSEIFESSDSISQALHFYKKHVFLKDSLLNKASQDKILTLEVEYETEKKENEILMQKTKIAEKNLIIFATLFSLILAIILGYFYYNNQKIKAKNLEQDKLLQEAHAKIEIQNKLYDQRMRISQDLHDNIGARLSFIASSIQNLKYLKPQIDENENEKIELISKFAKQTINELRDTIWAMNKENLSLEDIKLRLTNFISEANQSTDEKTFMLKSDEYLPLNYSFNAEQGINLYRIIQEAFNNSFKHSTGNEININMKKSNQDLIVEVQDNGQGFDLEKVEKGNGLINMKKRIKLLNGLITFENTKDGTIVKLSIPMK